MVSHLGDGISQMNATAEYKAERQARIRNGVRHDIEDWIRAVP
jgi:hypothetical protein